MSDARYNYFDGGQSRSSSSSLANTFVQGIGNYGTAYPLDGLQSEVTVEHHKGRYVLPITVNQNGAVVHPFYEQPDTNKLVLHSNLPITGILYIL